MDRFRYTNEHIPMEGEAFRLIVEFATDAIIVIDGQSTILYANPSTERVFGYPVSELLGHDLTMLMPQRFRDGHAKAMREYAGGKHGLILQRVVEWKGLRKGGVEIPLRIAYNEFIDKGQHRFAGIVRDISDYVEAESVQRRLAAIVETSDDAIFSKTLDGIICTWNYGAQKTYGYTPEEIIGKSVSILVPPGRPDEIPGILVRLAKGERIDHYETVRVTKHGQQIYVSLTISPITDNEGNVVAASTIARDITERKRAEITRKELTKQQQEFYRRTILAATEGKLEICDKESMDELAGPVIATWELRSPEDEGRIREKVKDIAESLGMDEDRVFGLLVSAGEAMTNALKHAGGGIVYLHKANEALTLEIADFGKGIEALELPRVALTRGYSTAGTLGMGYKAMISLADRIYLSTGPTGTTVAIRMGIRKAEKPPLEAFMLSGSW